MNNELINRTISSREGLRLLAAIIHTQHNGKLPMLDCLQAAEGMLTEALIVDSKQVHHWQAQQEQLAAQDAQLSSKVM